MCALLSQSCISYLSKNSSTLFLQLEKLDRVVIVEGREFQIFGPDKELWIIWGLFGNDACDNCWVFLVL